MLTYKSGLEKCLKINQNLSFRSVVEQISNYSYYPNICLHKSIEKSLLPFLINDKFNEPFKLRFVTPFRYAPVNDEILYSYVCTAEHRNIPPRATHPPKATGDTVALH